MWLALRPNLTIKRKYLLVPTVLLTSFIAVPMILREVVTRVQEKMNPVLRRPPYAVSPEAARLHASLTVADLHSDALLWGLDLTHQNKAGHVDIPRLIEGNVALQVFSAVTQVPKIARSGGLMRDSDEISKLVKVNLWPLRTWSSLCERALYQARQLRNFEQRSHGTLTIVTSRQELENFLARRQNNPSMVAGMLSLEGAHALDGELENIDALYEAGFCIVGLHHYFNNELGGASLDVGNAGLTEFGREVVKRLDEKGIIVDLAHSSPRSLDDVLDLTTRPVLVTHTGVDGVCPSPRNLSDDQIQRVVGRGGLIGIGYGPFFNCEPGVNAIVHSIRYVADHFGVEYAALGSDFDGTIQAPIDTAGLALITQELLAHGFTPDEVRLVMGGNIINFLLQHLP